MLAATSMVATCAGGLAIGCFPSLLRQYREGQGGPIEMGRGRWFLRNVGKRIIVADTEAEAFDVDVELSDLP